MRRRHFEALSPLCTVCRQARSVERALELTAVFAEIDDIVLEGILQCPDGACRREYPIIEGIPILLRDVRTYVQNHLLEIVRRDELPAPLESLVGDCCGPGSPFDTLRQHTSTYGASHFGDLRTAVPPGADGGSPAAVDAPTDTSPDGDPAAGDPAAGDPAAGDPAARATASLLALLTAARRLAEAQPAGPILDLGCAVGRTSFELGQWLAEADPSTADGAPGDLVLGVDLHFGMLRLAGRLSRGEPVALPLRRSGVSYGRRFLELESGRLGRGLERVDFWACDALDLPFADGAFAALSALNVLDCLSSPLDGLREMGRVLRHRAPLWMSSPYDWSPAATPFEGWLGGHSDRGLDGGHSDRRLRAFLAEPSLQLGLDCIGEKGAMPWLLRLHDRSVMEYAVDLLALRRRSPAESHGP